MAGDKEQEKFFANSEQTVHERENQPRMSVKSIELMNVLVSSLQFGDSSVQLPRSMNVDEWGTFIRESGKNIDLLKLPLRYPTFAGTYLVVNRRSARELLLQDFEDVDMFRGEKEFFAAFQGGVIFRQADREEWKKARRAISPHFSPKNVEAYDRGIGEAVSASTADLIKDVDEQDGPTSRMFQRFVTETLFQTHLGRRIPKEEADKLVSSFQAFYKAAPSIVLGLDRFQPVHDFVHGKLKPYNQVVEDAVVSSLLEENSGMMIKFLRDHKVDANEWFHTVFAGQSSLATSLEWITYHLAINKDAQDTLRASKDTPEYPEKVGVFLEDTARKFPTPTFLLRETLTPLHATTTDVSKRSMIVVPLFGIQGDTGDEEGITSEGMYDLQFSPGLRRCLGRYVCESIHRQYVTDLLESTSEVSCLNRPTPTIGMTVCRPDKEFQFVFN